MIAADTLIDRYGYCARHGIPVAVNTACVDCVGDKPDVVPARRLNVGCGQYPILYFTNLDEDPRAIADFHQRVPPIPFEDGSLDEIYCGHFLEHLADPRLFLLECYRCLAPGGKLGIVVPDTREIMTRWLAGSLDCVEYPEGTWSPVADLDAVCGLFLYSTVQDSRHLWSYDQGTLARAMTRAGFVNLQEIDRYRDPRIPVGAWYQVGVDGFKP